MINRFLCVALAVSAGCLGPVDEAPTVENLVQPAQMVAAPNTWTPLTHQPPFLAGVAMLLTDGTVMAHNVGTENWWRLTPDINGSYIEGTWTQLASMSPTHQPTYFASAVLPDGRVIVQGGEYNGNAQSFTNQGALYDPLTNKWVVVDPPPGFANIGDASGMVLPDGAWMISSALTDKTALLNLADMTWKPTGAGKADVSDEETWVLLPDDTILTVDCGANINKAEIYDPATGMWSAAALPPVPLVDPASQEIGPAVLLTDGTVFLTGGNGHNAVYDTKTKMFSAAPDFPIVASGQLDVADGPAALLPNGKVLVLASPGVFQPDLHAFEWNGATLTEVAGPPGSPGLTTFPLTMLVLPTGEIMLTGQSADVEIYTPAAGVTENAIPLIMNVPKLITQTDPDPMISDAAVDEPAVAVELLPVMTMYASRSYKLRGNQLNGISQGAQYGDDNQSYTNYPLVRFTNVATNHVTYARTHGHSTMSIRPGLVSTTRFDIPANAERGISNMVVVTNGIASPSMLVNIK